MNSPTPQRDPLRWNGPQAAADYDAAATVIHPQYLAVQDALLATLPFTADQAFRVVDLGGGSGRLAERLLAAFPNCHATVVDQSQAFLDLAALRLTPFAERCRFVLSPVQDAIFLSDGLPGLAANVIVSTSALHHLEPAEKQAVYQTCYNALKPGGAFINGDEYRPEREADYRQMLEDWGRHMETAHAAGDIPASFGEIIAKWRRRNLDDFGGPRQTGDDCHETIETQKGYLRAAGFSRVEVAWEKQLWAVVAAWK